MWIRAILVVVLVCLLILHFQRRLQASKKYPPGPVILRMVLKFIQTGFSMPPDMLTEKTKQYGNIYSIWGGPMPLVVLSGLEAVKEALIKNSEAFAGRPVTPFYDVLTHGNGIVLANGKLWKKQRKFGVNTFWKLGMGKNGVELKIQDEAEQLLEAFTKAKGQPFDPSFPLSYSVCSVVCALVFGHRYAFDDEEFLELIQSIECGIQFGGSALHFKVQKEIDEAVGSSPSISYQDRKKVPYTMAALHESQRFKCILLSGNPRETVKDVTVLGTFIPKGTTILPDMPSIVYDPKLWETPRKFNPNHFLDKDGKFVDREELLLFGAGARVCLGKQMARMELFIFFTSLMRAFTFKLPEGVKANLEPIKGMTSSP